MVWEPSAMTSTLRHGKRGLGSAYELRCMVNAGNRRAEDNHRQMHGLLSHIGPVTPNQGAGLCQVCNCFPLLGRIGSEEQRGCVRSEGNPCCLSSAHVTCLWAKLNLADTPMLDHSETVLFSSDGGIIGVLGNPVSISTWLHVRSIIIPHLFDQWDRDFNQRSQKSLNWIRVIINFKATL